MSFVIGGDIGGTRARFSLVEVTKGQRRKTVHHDVLESRRFTTFEATLEAFLARAPKKKVAAASFGIAGPVVEGRVKATNLPWTIDSRKVSRVLGGATTTLLNDLVAVGLGALDVPASKLRALHGARPKRTGGNVAVIAAGTGLGEAMFVWDATEKRHLACPTEGGHTDFAPQSPLEEKLRAKLAAEHGHVSYERVASGSTISMLYHFFVHDERVGETKKAAAFFAAAADPNVAVVELAERGESEAAKRALDLWARVYGAEAGNLALKCLATGGVLVCGGVSARLADVLGGRGTRASTFLEGYREKGRMRPLLDTMPVAIVIEPRAGLLGAIAHAASKA